jgi:hypothetical protein
MTLIPVGPETLAGSIARAAMKAEERHQAEETRATGPKPKPLPLPTKREAWEAFVQLVLDRDEPMDRERFEAWWRGEIALSGESVR